MPTDRTLEKVNRALDEIEHVCRQIWTAREKIKGSSASVEDRLTYLEEQMDLIASLMTRL